MALSAYILARQVVEYRAYQRAKRERRAKNLAACERSRVNLHQMFERGEITRDELEDSIKQWRWRYERAWLGYDD